MEQAHLLVVRLGDNEIIDRESLSGAGSMNEIYARWLNVEINKFAKLGMLAYAHSARDFSDTLIAQIFLKEGTGEY